MLKAGVFRVILGTAALKNWDWFESLMGNPTYRGRLVLGLDAREGKLAVSGWEETTEVDAIDIAEQICITRDNVQVGVDGVLYMQVLDPARASGARVRTIPASRDKGPSCVPSREWRGPKRHHHRLR